MIETRRLKKVVIFVQTIIYTTCKFLIYCNKEETVSENITQCMTFPRVENIT